MEVLYTRKVYRNMWDPIQAQTGGTKRAKIVHVNTCSIRPCFEFIAIFVLRWSATACLEAVSHCLYPSLQSSYNRISQSLKNSTCLLNLLATLSYTYTKYFNAGNSCRIHNRFQVPQKYKSSGLKFTYLFKCKQIVRIISWTIEEEKSL